MAKKIKGFNKVLCWVLAVLSIVGGLEHVGQSYDMFSILSWIPNATFSSIVQLVAGISIVYLAVWKLMRLK